MTSDTMVLTMLHSVGSATVACEGVAIVPHLVAIVGQRPSCMMTLMRSVSATAAVLLDPPVAGPCDRVEYPCLILTHLL